MLLKDSVGRTYCSRVILVRLQSTLFNFIHFYRHLPISLSWFMSLIDYHDISIQKIVPYSFDCVVVACGLRINDAGNETSTLW